MRLIISLKIIKYPMIKYFLDGTNQISNLSPTPIGTEKLLLNQAKSLEYLRIEKNVGLKIR